eukprot:GSMAST32.ASY1.ANO1.1648.1 assembled CDS
MTFGWAQASSKVDDAVASEMLEHFSKAGLGTHFDTARIYASGESETMAGRIRPSGLLGEQFRVVTKAHPSQKDGLSKKGLCFQLEKSMDALQLKHIPVLYLHQPDPENPLEETLEALESLIEDGVIGTVGLSNYSAAEVERAVELCNSHGWYNALPTVYQGLYSPLNRRVETELLPTLRAYDVSFVAYNPLAGGMLSVRNFVPNRFFFKNKYFLTIHGRFKDNPNYLDRFYKKDVFAAVQLLQESCNNQNDELSLTQASFSWMMNHSMLGKNDGILIGASKIEHLISNLNCCEAAQPLSPVVLDAFDKAWEITKEDSFLYFRGYSKDMPPELRNGDGATYQV